MKVTLMLADAAQAVGNKLYILGGGWSTIVIGGTFAIAIKVEVPYSVATDTHTLRLDLVDADGAAVTASTTDGDEKPVVVENTFCTGIPPQIKAGTPMDYAFAITVQGLELEPNERYEWRLTIDGGDDEDWCLAFNTIPPMPPFAKAA